MLSAAQGVMKLPRKPLISRKNRYSGEVIEFSNLVELFSLVLTIMASLVNPVITGGMLHYS